MIEIVAWGVRHGAAPQADHIFTLTGLRNPHRLKGLKDLTGWDQVVWDDVWGTKEANDKYDRVLRVVIQDLEDDDPKNLRVVFVCTGGRHRSVCFARRMKQDLEARGESVRLFTPFTTEKPASEPVPHTDQS